MDVRQYESDIQIKQDKNYALATFISGIVSLLGLLLGLICFKNGNREQTIFCACYSPFFLFVTIYTIKTKRLNLFNFSIQAFMIFSEFFYIKNGGSGGFGLIWITLCPFFSVYLFDKFNFYTFNGSLLFILFLGLWSPLYKFAYDIGDSFRLRLPIIFSMEFIFGSYLKYRIEKTEKELANQKNILSDEIKNAALIQKSFLSKESENYKDWSISTKNVPMMGVTGDLYCVFDKNEKLYGLGLFDISGHGISSGLLTMLAKNTIEHQFYHNLNSNPLWETVEKINNQFIKEKGEVQNYLTGILVKIDDDNLEIVNAGQQEPIIYKKASDSFEILKRDKKSMGVIGISDFPTFYISQFLNMQSGDRLFLYTDGIVDCKNSENQSFGRERFIETIKKFINNSVSEQSENIINEINLFRGKNINDDFTLMILGKN